MRNVSNLVSRWKEVILITISVRALLFILTGITNPITITNLFHAWVRWDDPHYIDIAQKGYQVSGEESLWIVFYPLYPFLIKLSNLLVNDYTISAILISLVFSFTASILLFELTLLDFNK